MSIRDWIFGKKAAIAVTALEETTRDGVNKAYIPKFLYKPPFGYPRYANMSYIRYLAQTPYVDMCIQTIIDEISALEWDVFPAAGTEDQADESEIQNIKNFFLNPNTNRESFNEVFVDMPVRDILEINAGILNKIFNMKEEMVEVVARDGATFTKNPDVHGMYTNREDIILPKEIVENPQEVVNPFQQYGAAVAREASAYFQYGWIAGPVPIPFGRKEIIWLEKKKRTDDHYSYSPVQILANTLQTLLYMIESDLEYYNDNNVPKGIIGLEDSDADEIEMFKEQWFESQRKKDDFGNWKKIMNKVPIVNKIPQFTRVEFSAAEMQLIEKQKWYIKMVFASFGVTPVELGYTEDAKGSANQIVQSKVFRKKAINPMVRLLENKYNTHIVSEFDYWATIKTEKGKTITVPKYEFKWKQFDTDEERSKAELYEIQIRNGIKTVNEIRVEEGDDEVEWGNDPPKNWMSGQNNFSFGGDGFSQRQQDAQDTRQPGKEPDTREPDQDKRNKEAKALSKEQKELLDDIIKYMEKKLGKKLTEEKKAEIKSAVIEGKPFAGYSNFADCVSKNQDKKDPKAYCAEIMRKVEGKAQNSAIDSGIPTPVDVAEGERPTNFKRLEKAIKYVLKQNEKKIKDFLAIAVKSTTLPEKKDINDVVERLKAVLSFEGLRQITMSIVKNNYLKGWDEAEKNMDRNYSPETRAMDFLAEYTFDNIKGMEDDIANKLRQELQRGYMAGEGIDKIKARVTKVFDIGENRAEMIARTETNRASNTGKLQAFQKAGVKGKKEWVTHFDDRTSAICKRLDGQQVALDKNFKDSTTGWEGQNPPSHPNCRSGWIFIPQTKTG